MQNRRKFLKNSLITAAGAGLAANVAYGSNPRLPGNRQERNFVYRTLGRTGIRIPVISMGLDSTKDPNLIRQALDENIMLLVTHETYYGGNSERIIGEVVKGRDRDSYMIMTGALDVNTVDEEKGLYRSEASGEDLLRRAEGCLQRLQLDYIDIFILSYAARRESVFFEPYLKAMETLKKQGKTRFLAIATHSFQPEAIRAAVDTGIYDIAMTAYNFRMDNLQEMDEALKYAEAADLGIIGMKALAGVYWDQERTLPINPAAAIKWVLENENIHTVCPACSSYEQLYLDIGIMENLKLNEKEKHDLLPPQGELSSGLYCQQCGRCIAQCPKRINIPAIMRSYMYAYGYGNLDHAYRTLCSARLDPTACRNCTSCSVNCAMGFDVRTKILDIARLQDDMPDDFMVPG
ncbi:MAG: aldo/keto reductase [Bacteroidales bacterium]|nr:aldo/keto reductase [Bacteroidales bacterium]